MDVWAFGCVLFECLPALRAFPGETLSDVLAAVLKNESNWNELPSTTPVHPRILLSRCFAKNPQHRLRAVGDAELLLASPLEARAPIAKFETRRVPEDSELESISQSGGASMKIADVPTGDLLFRGAGWGDDGLIVLAPSIETGLFRVAATGGELFAQTFDQDTLNVFSRPRKIISGVEHDPTTGVGGFDLALDGTLA